MPTSDGYKILADHPSTDTNQPPTDKPEVENDPSVSANSGTLVVRES